MLTRISESAEHPCAGARGFITRAADDEPVLLLLVGSLEDVLAGTYGNEANVYIDTRSGALLTEVDAAALVPEGVA